MHLLRLVLIVAGYCLLPLLHADDAAPFTMEKHYSADVVITSPQSGNITSKTYVDDEKTRSDVTASGMNMAIIVRKDKQKVYQLLPAQKMAMEMPYDPERFKDDASSGLGPKGKFDLIGPDGVDGIACTKYKVTPESGKEVFFFWLDAAKKVPVQMTDEAGTLKVRWKNFKAGPQDASLFEVPAGFKLMPLKMPDAAGGGQ